MTRLTVTAIALGMATAALSAASAAQRVQRPAAPAVIAPKEACIKLCVNDYSPCDPIYFKTADNRCSNRRNER